MNDKEFEDILEEMDKFKDKIINESPEKSREFLQRAGILDKNGKLAQQYGGEGERT